MSTVLLRADASGGRPAQPKKAPAALDSGPVSGQARYERPESALLAALIFSLKTFAAALLALFLAFWLALDEPAWALLTVFVVSQPDSGLVLAKSFFRMLGTTAGVLVSGALVFAFSQYGELFVASLALWIGLCTFAARAARNFTAYGFLLAGYTAAIVGIPAALNPNGAYPLILARFTEISLGIFCSGIVSTLILPHELRPKLLALVSALACRADRLAASRFDSTDWKRLTADRIALVKDFASVEAMRSSAFFESPEARLSNEALGNMIDSALHLSVTAEGGLAGRLSGACPQVLASFIPLTCDTPRGNGKLVSMLVGAEASRNVDEARAQLRHSEEAYVSGNAAPGQDAPHLIWSDAPEAMITGVRSALAVLISSAFWFVTAWPTGSVAVMVAGVASSLVSGMKQQVKVSFAFALALIVTAIPIFVTTFHLIPAATDFLSLAVALAPLLIALGFILPVQPLAVFVVFYFTIASGIDNTMSYDVSQFFNYSLAILIGIGVTMVMFATFFPENEARAIARIHRQLLTQLCRFASPLHPPLLSFERALVDYLAVTLESVDRAQAQNECLKVAGAALQAAGAIDGWRHAVSAGCLDPELAGKASTLFGEISEIPHRPGGASFTLCAWEARSLKQRLISLTRTTTDSRKVEGLCRLIASCEALRRALLNARVLLQETPHAQ
jgi:uncharacterized membrane protein YccC